VAPKLTKNQTLVFDILTKKQSSLSAYDILDHLRGEGMRAPLQVYRALERLIELDLVHRLESKNSFIACSHKHDQQVDATCLAAFAICDACGSVTEFMNNVVQEQLDEWASNHSFVATKSTVELTGLCGSCSAASE